MGADHRKLARREPPADRELGVRHAVAVTGLGLALIGPGCGFAVGAAYGAPLQGALFGAALVAFASAFVLPTLISRGARRGR